MKINVTKRDGSTEPFSLSKIEKVVVAAGLSKEQAEALLAKVKAWIELNKKGIVSSLEIRDQVLLEMEKIDDYAANMYRWYQKTKDSNLVSSN